MSNFLTVKRFLWGGALFFLLPIENVMGKEMQHIYRSAYFLGRGDTGISTADYQEAIFYNPAGLAVGTGIYKETVLFSPMVELSRASKDLAKQVSVEGKSPVDAFVNQIGNNQHLGLYNFTGFIFRRMALGTFTATATDILISKAPESNGVETVALRTHANQGITFSLAEGFFDKSIFMGLTGKYVYRGQGEVSVNLMDTDSINNIDQSDVIGYGSGMGGDFGLQWRGTSRLKPSFGFTVMDIGNTKIVPIKKTTVLDPIYQRINVGYSIEPGTKTSRFKLLFELHDIGTSEEKNMYKKIHLGGELTFRGFMGFTGGLSQGYGTGGAYIDLWFLRVDAGAYTEELGSTVGMRPDTRYFCRIKAGF